MGFVQKEKKYFVCLLYGCSVSDLSVVVVVKWNGASAFKLVVCSLLNAEICRFSPESVSQYTDSSACEPICGPILKIHWTFQVQQKSGRACLCQTLGLSSPGRYRKV